MYHSWSDFSLAGFKFLRGNWGEGGDRGKKTKVNIF